MSAYIGPLGQLVKFKCPSAEQIQFTDRSSFKTTMGGRVVEQRGPRSRRTWDVDISATTPNEIAGLLGLYLGVASGPWHFLPPDALSVNMLTPEVSLLLPGTYQSPGTDGGAVAADDGFRIPSTITVPASSQVFLGPSEDALRWGAPVIPGDTYTASVYGNGIGATFSMIFRDMARATVGTISSGAMGAARVRHSATGVAPAGAVEVLLRLNTTSTASRFGAPAVTLGGALTPWGIGGSSRKSGIESMSQAVTHAVPGSKSLNRANTQMTVRELG